MKSQINTLRQLQELVLIRDEHSQNGDGCQLDALTDSISALRGKLEPRLAGLYDRLYKKNHVVIASMSNGCCAACGMQVPIAQAQQVRLCQNPVTCSSCGRILFADDADAARAVVDKEKDKEDRVDSRSGISRFCAPELVSSNLSATTVQDAIAELAGMMQTNKFIINADSLVAAAMEREALLSTALGGGIAFPHVRGVEGGSLTMAMGVSKKGIDWAGEKVNIVFLSAIPVAVSAFYMRLMGGIAQAFDKDDNRKLVLSAKTDAELWKALLKVTRHTVK